MFCMHLHNSCRRNSNHLILLIKTAYAHKETMLLQTIINTFKSENGRGIETETKRMMAAK